MCFSHVPLASYPSLPPYRHNALCHPEAMGGCIPALPGITGGASDKRKRDF